MKDVNNTQKHSFDGAHYIYNAQLHMWWGYSNASGNMSQETLFKILYTSLQNLKKVSGVDMFTGITYYMDINLYYAY